MDSQILKGKNVVFGEYHNDSNTYFHYSSLKYLKNDCNIFIEDNLYLNLLKELYLFDGDSLFIKYLQENVETGKDYNAIFLLSLISDTSLKAKNLLRRIYFFDVNFLKFHSYYSYLLERIFFVNVFRYNNSGDKEDFIRKNPFAIMTYKSFKSERRHSFKYARIDPLFFKFRATYRDKMMYKNYQDLKVIINNDKRDILFTGNYHVERENLQNERALYNNKKFCNRLDSNYVLIKSFVLPIYTGNRLEYKTYKGAQSILDNPNTISEPQFFNVSKNVGAFDYLYVYPLNYKY